MRFVRGRLNPDGVRMNLRMDARMAVRTAVRTAVTAALTCALAWALAISLSAAGVRAAASAAAAPAAPDFTGTWTADLKASDFGMMGAPDRAVMNVTHKEPEVTIHSELSVGGNPIMWEATCKTDGKECKGTKGDVTISLQWQGESLVLNRALSVGGMSLKVKETWTLSPDGKTLTSARGLTSDQGSLSQKIIFTKS